MRANINVACYNNITIFKINLPVFVSITIEMLSTDDFLYYLRVVFFMFICLKNVLLGNAKCWKNDITLCSLIYQLFNDKWLKIVQSIQTSFK